MRKTIVFGTGLGMALDSQYFTLKKAIAEVWTNGSSLSSVDKDLIEKCLDAQGCKGGMPSGEDDLDILQRAIGACDILKDLGDNDLSWLSDHGERFPGSIRKFIHYVSRYFHTHTKELNLEFIDALGCFVSSTESHIATLNYDSLLYGPLIERGVLSGYSGALVDGFYSSGFNGNHLTRKYGKTFGYYMHLHGSPLFVERGGEIVKLSRFESIEPSDILGKHIVLTHVKHKPSIIDSSDLLYTYWYFLEYAFEESEEIVLFGYSGYDTHLNNVIKRYVKRIPVKVIEWKGVDDRATRKSFWETALGSSNLKLKRLDNILDFDDW